MFSGQYTDLEDGKCGHKVFYGNGQIMHQKFFRGEKLDGKCVSWYDNGRIWSRKFYRDGKLEGISRVWYENGLIGSKVFYRNGIKEGEDKFWHPDGSILEDNFYRDSRIIYNNFYRRKKQGFYKVKRIFLDRSVRQLDRMLISDLVKMIK